MASAGPLRQPAGIRQPFVSVEVSEVPVRGWVGERSERVKSPLFSKMGEDHPFLEKGVNITPRCVSLEVSEVPGRAPCVRARVSAVALTTSKAETPITL